MSGYNTAAQNKDEDKQVICWGLSNNTANFIELLLPMMAILISVLPEDCDNGLSNHSRNCQVNLFTEVGCLEEGTVSPSVQNESDIERQANMNLR